MPEEALQRLKRAKRIVEDLDYEPEYYFVYCSEDERVCDEMWQITSLTPGEIECPECGKKGFVNSGEKTIRFKFIDPTGGGIEGMASALEEQAEWLRSLSEEGYEVMHSNNFDDYYTLGIYFHKYSGLNDIETNSAAEVDW